MELKTAELPKVLERLRRAKRVAIFTHQRPDPDALGSQAAAACLMAGLGAEKIYRMQFGEAPGPYRFLLESGAGEVAMWGSEWAGSAGGGIDTVLLVDTCTYQQLEPAAGYLKAEKANVVAIDHHLSRDDVGPAAYMYTDTSAAACVEILWDVVKLAGLALDERMALPLFAGLVGDTGWFRFDSVTARTHLMAAEMVKHVDPSALYERLMQNETRPKLALMQRALASVRWSGGASGEAFACMLLRHADFVETGAAQSMTEYLVDMPMMIGTSEVVALMTEMADGRVRVSLRSKHGVDVNKVCNAFDGGGHAKAAGCRMDGPLEEAYGRLAGVVGEALGK